MKWSGVKPLGKKGLGDRVDQTRGVSMMSAIISRYTTTDPRFLDASGAAVLCLIKDVLFPARCAVAGREQKGQRRGMFDPVSSSVYRSNFGRK